MRGTLRYRAGAWRLTADAGKNALGKRVRLNRTVRAPNTRAGRKEADKALAALVLEAEERAGQTSDTTTVEAFLEGWIERRSPEWAPSTRNIEPGTLRRHVIPHIGDLALVDLKRRHVAELHRVVGQTVSPSTVGNVHRILHRALADAVTLELLEVNPASGVRPPRAPKPDVRPPTDDELDAIIEAITDPQFATIVRLDAIIGSRRGELAALRWSDLDLDAGTVAVTRAMSIGAKSEGLVERQTKTGAKLPAKALDTGTTAELRAHRARRIEQCMATGVRMVDDGFVFTPANDPSGRVAIRPERISRQFAAACKRARVTGVRFHDLRHRVASILIAEGLDVQSVAAWLGHSSAKLTLDTYGHLIPGEDRRAAETLARRRSS